MRNAIPALTLVFVMTGIAAAQTTAPETDRIRTIDELPPLELESDVPPRPRGKVRYGLSTGVGMQSGGSEFDVFRAKVGVNASMTLNPDVDLSLSFGYAFDNYDFDADSFFGSDVWDQVNTYGVRANFDFKLTSNWTLFAGPVFQVSHESGAEFDESWIAGGFLGLTYRADPGVVIGTGLLVTSQLQDKAKVSPVIILEWEVTNDIKLTSRGTSGLAGVNLVFDLTEKLDLSFGISYVFKRFRMDDQGIFPGGVGEETSLPVQIAATYVLSPTATITAYAGVVLSGEIILENRDGGKMFDEYDPMAVFGVNLAMRF